ncbi:MAG: AEC family transporter [Synergistaceae bacterium]|nr:AEC family transporter [Synergistaceae bacterium]
MKLDFFVVFSHLFSLFVLIAAGYFSVRLGAIKAEFSGAFSAFLVKITLPCTIFISLAIRKYDPEFIRDGIILVITGVTIFVFTLYFCRFIARFMGVREGSRGVWSFTCAFSNTGFMGFPVSLALLGIEGLALAVMFNISFNLTVYTLGAIEISRDNPDNKSGKLDMKAIIFSSVNLATVLSFIFYFLQIKLPAIVAAPINYLSGITTPLSMFIIGMALARSKISELFTDKSVWTSAIIRLLVVPVIVFFLLKFITLSANPLVRAVVILIIAMPAPSMTTVLSELYGGNIDFAAKAMFIHNLFCMLTIPLICMLI